MAYSISNACTGCTACQAICPVDAVSGEKKLLHAIDPDACIHCGACGRICPAAAVTDSFGLTVSRIPRKAWPRPWFNLDLCMSCTACLDACPTRAISQLLQKVGSRHLFPYLEDAKKCIACGFCAQECPVEAIEMGKAPDALPSKAREDAA